MNTTPFTPRNIVVIGLLTGGLFELCRFIFKDGGYKYIYEFCENYPGWAFALFSGIVAAGMLWKNGIQGLLQGVPQTKN